MYDTILIDNLYYYNKYLETKYCCIMPLMAAILLLREVTRDCYFR